MQKDTESKIQKRYSDSSKQIANNENLKSFNDFLIREVWKVGGNNSGFCLLDETTGKENSIETGGGDGLDSNDGSSPDSRNGRGADGNLKFSRIMEDIRGKAALELWRDALLVQPAVDDLAEEIIEHLNTEDQMNSKFRRVLSLSKSMQRGKWSF